ncbi:hypothetical protein LPJ54_005342 [Coemansia sp. RSA 1824]|nr:hypothetical protein LPJ54_005342 [Coemansia sp. RSA 1824]
MAVYSCRPCGVHFDSKTWYSGHLQRVHSRPTKIEISSTPTLEPDSAVDPLAKYKSWSYRLSAFIRRRVKS